MQSGSKRGRASPSSNNRLVATCATAANAAYVLSLQILALVTLSPAQFGLFSIQYLLFALGSSLGLSVICEPWLRRIVHEQVEGSWRDYSTVLIWLSLAVATATVAVSAVIPALRDIAWLGGAAVLLSSYRAGARYHDVRSSRWVRVLLSDAAGFLTILVTWIVCWAFGTNALAAIAVAWAAGALVSSVLSPVPRFLGVEAVRRWFASHRTDIAPLLRDSLLLDIGAIGTPFVVAGLLGVSDFGVYRAISNIAAPVRLLLNPLRPTLASMPLSANAKSSRRLLAICVGFAFGVAAYLALWVIGILPTNLGALSAVVPFALAAAVFVAANFLGHYYYIIARSHSSSQQLMTGRLVQTVLAIALPLIGASAFGLAGAIWGYSLATALSAATWLAIVARVSRR